LPPTQPQTKKAIEGSWRLEMAMAMKMANAKWAERLLKLHGAREIMKLKN